MFIQDDPLLSDAEFHHISKIVYSHCGIRLSEHKRDFVRARIARQVRAGNYESASAYLDYVLANKNSPAFMKFIDAISTNLTSFYREHAHFDYLTHTFLPALWKKKSAAGEKRVRVWSAACSTGEEPYTLAMVLSDSLAKTGHGLAAFDIRILATDISSRVLQAAEAGVYDDARLAQVPEAQRGRYFTRKQNVDEPQAGGPQWSAIAALRAMIRFRSLNLMDRWPFHGPFDFIFCRNVMIYFDRPTQEKLVGRFWECLRPAGLLFTGHSESLSGLNHRFSHLKPSIYEKP